MTVWVALLRAVNVSGANILPMAGFRAMLTRIGLENPKTYIQSGNVVFRSGHAAPALAQQIADGILAGFGFRPPVLIMTAADLTRALVANPFPQAMAQPTHLHAFFMEKALPDAGFAFLRALASPTEHYAVRGKVLWLYLPDGLARSKLARRVMALPVDITARNLRSVQAIADLAQKLAQQPET